MKIYNQTIAKRWNSVMNNIGCEHLTFDTRLSELEREATYYGAENGHFTVGWMLEEAEYWLSCYYEGGNMRCDDRFIDAENYSIWKSETGKLERLIKRLKALDPGEVIAEAEYEEKA